jgi:hypothetical protein
MVFDPMYFVFMIPGLLLTLHAKIIQDCGSYHLIEGPVERVGMALAMLGIGRDTVRRFARDDIGRVDLAALEAFVDRVLGPTSANPRLSVSLAVLLESGCRWSEAAERLGVHRHTLRYRMDRLREVTGRHPDDPEQRMELWLALRAHDALEARRGSGTS